jgi:hypothetical protein
MSDKKQNDKWNKDVVRVTVFLAGSVKDKFKHELDKGYKETELVVQIMRKHFNRDNRF